LTTGRYFVKDRSGEKVFSITPLGRTCTTDARVMRCGNSTAGWTLERVILTIVKRIRKTRWRPPASRTYAARYDSFSTWNYSWTPTFSTNYIRHPCYAGRRFVIKYYNTSSGLNS